MTNLDRRDFIKQAAGAVGAATQASQWNAHAAAQTASGAERNPPAQHSGEHASPPHGFAFSRSRKAIEFAWIEDGFDSRRNPVLEGVQHNARNLELHGPNPMDWPAPCPAASCKLPRQSRKPTQLSTEDLSQAAPRETMRCAPSADPPIMLAARQKLQIETGV